jgi:hypothetical protein
VIERREHLGGEDGMTVGEHEHGRAEANAFGDGGDEPEGDQRDAIAYGMTTWSLAQSESYPSASMRRAKPSSTSRVAAGP